MVHKNNKIGVLLVNLGTPDGTDFKNMRKYLRQFLSDKRVIEWPRLFWYPILYGIVLNLRPKKSGALYKRIWNHQLNESPLRTFTRAQAKILNERFAHISAKNTLIHKSKSDESDIIVDYAMRYGQPSIENVTNTLMARGCDRVLYFPLYPQYSATTTATVLDDIFDSLKKRRLLPAIRTVPAYCDDDVYIDALAKSIKNHLAKLSYKPEKIIASYHGIPQSYAKRGDPYPQECARTTAALRQKLSMTESQLLMTFQSRFGPEEWLQPYTDVTIENLAKQGVKSLTVLNPGFVVDCLETIDEIGHEAKETFLENGGENFTHIPCLNDSDEGIAVLEALLHKELAGWL